MARVLVTGCAGFLASHLCDRLLADGHRVIGIDNLSGGDITNVPAGVEFMKMDCCNLDKVSSLFGWDGEINLVFHCAASPHEGLSVFSPVRITQDTYMSSVVVGTAAIQAGVKRLVFCSSMARYGVGWGRSKFVAEPGEFMPFTEDLPAYPVDPYGIAKKASEDVLHCLGRQHGLEVVTLVPHNLIGERQRYCDPFRNVASIMTNLMLQGRSPVIYGDGTQRRVFSYVGDCIEPLVRAGFLPGLDGQVINIGPDDNPVTINQLAGMLSTLIGVPHQPPVYYPDRPCEVKHAWPSSDKARRLLKYETRTSLQDSLLAVIRWVRDNGPKDFIYHLPLEIVNEHTPKTWKERLF